MDWTDKLNRSILKLGRACIVFGISCAIVFLTVFLTLFVYSIFTGEINGMAGGVSSSIMGLFMYLALIAMYTAFVGPVNAIMLYLLDVLRINNAINNRKAIALESAVYIIAIIYFDTISDGNLYDTYWPFAFIVPGLIIIGLIQKAKARKRA